MSRAGPAAAVPVEVVDSARARRISLRVDPARGRVVLVVPRGVPHGEALAFARRQQAWIAARLASQPQGIPFAEGAVLPVFGCPRTIRRVQGQLPAVVLADDELRVCAPAARVGDGVAFWLRAEARRVLTERSHRRAAEIGARVAGVTVRDTRSRWGSASSRGTLSYSWRLILAPEPVLDYLVAHEVSHLIEANHSPAFWRLVTRLDPDWRTARAWLRANGASLHRYGAAAP